MFNTLEEDMMKVDAEQVDPQQHRLRVVGFLAMIGGLTILLFGGLYAAIRFME